MSEAKVITAYPLTARAFRPFGYVLSLAAGSDPSPANRGSAQMVGRLGRVKNERPGSATENWKVYRCTPDSQRPVQLHDFEKHPFSSQMFAPLGGRSRYLVTVAHGGQSPDLNTLRAFVATPDQAIIYYPGVWHQPMTLLDGPADMLSLVYEDGTEDDCHLIELDPADLVFVTLE